MIKPVIALLIASVATTEAVQLQAREPAHHNNSHRRNASLAKLFSKLRQGPDGPDHPPKNGTAAEHPPKNGTATEQPPPPQDDDCYYDETSGETYCWDDYGNEDYGYEEYSYEDYVEDALNEFIAADTNADDRVSKGEFAIRMIEWSMPEALEIYDCVAASGEGDASIVSMGEFQTEADLMWNWDPTSCTVQTFDKMYNDHSYDSTDDSMMAKIRKTKKLAKREHHNRRSALAKVRKHKPHH